jgi:hypothetical protein
MNWGNIGKAIPGFGMGSGYNSKVTSASLLSPEQQEYLKKILPQLFGATTGENSALEGVLGQTRSAAENTWSTKTRPELLATTGNLHSSYTGNKMGQMYNEMQMGLSGNEANMRYGAQQNAMQQLLAALGIGTKENIVDKPGMIEGIMGGIPGVNYGMK